MMDSQPSLCHGGLTYSGEVIRASRWSPAWGEPLSGDRYFRSDELVAFLRQMLG